MPRQLQNSEDAMSENQSLQQRINELEGLNRLAAALSSTLEIDQILKAIVETSASLCRAGRASIVLLDPSTRESVKTLVHQSDPTHGSIEHVINMAVAGWVLEHRKPLLAGNLIKGVGLKNPPERYRKHGSVLAVPLTVAGGEIIGIINLINEVGGECFNENSLRLGTIIAQQSAQFIHTARLHERLFRENQLLRQELKQQYNVGGIIGISKKMSAVLETIPIVAKSAATILLCGETGTGKELVARAIHFMGDRAEKPFIPLNCSAIPANLVESELFGHERGAFTGASAMVLGKFELADGGTIFLDEISEMPIDLQPKLLRCLEERKFFRLGSSVEKSVDVRVVAATNKDLLGLVAEGKFREDLYYRLNVMPIILPPLRERREDISVLAQYFLDEFSHKSKKFDPAALEILTNCEWKGNVRELRNIVERISLLIQDNTITPDHLQTMRLGGRSDRLAPMPMPSLFRSLLQSHDGKNDLLDEIEKNLVQLALSESNGNTSQAARKLGIDRKAMERRREKYSL